MFLVVVKFLSYHHNVNNCLHYYIFGPLDVVYQLFYIIHGMTHWSITSHFNVDKSLDRQSLHFLTSKSQYHSE